MPLSPGKIAQILNVNPPGDASQAISHVSIDSRSLQNGPQTLFVALPGTSNDGHEFIRDLLNRGVHNFVVSKPFEGPGNFYVVPDTRAALQQLASAYRGQFSFPVIGITGSNGKTIVKEWLNYLLGPDFNIIRSPKSYNSQVGVPLSVLAINQNHNLGIFEAGISQPGEMQRLEQIIRPSIGVLTSIGPQHDEGFESRQQKIAEKLTLFSNAKIVIRPKEPAIDAVASHLNAITWSLTDSSADVFIRKTVSGSDTYLQVAYRRKNFMVRIPFTDSASVENAATCLTVMLYLEYDPQVIARRMQGLYPVQMRLTLKNGINGSIIIDDSYSSDFQSLKIALDFLESQKQHVKKTVILSDIFQSGLPADELYGQVAALLESNKVTRVIGIGDTIGRHQGAFRNIQVFADTLDFLDNLPDFGGETILIKGARHFHFEDIVAALEEKTHETVLEINLNAISHNLNFYRSKIHPDTKLMAMVKAFGYGSGGLEIARLLEHHKVDYLGVAFADEGIALKSGGISLPIMVMNPESTSFGAIIQHKLEPEIYSLKGLKAFLRLATERKLRGFPIHIKLDTGMHRLGFDPSQVDDLISILANSPQVKVKSILSHLATSDDKQHDAFAQQQIELFSQLSNRMINALDIDPLRHILNTSGISNYGHAQFDMVRLGIGLYGVSNDPDEQPLLENVGTLKSIISQLRLIASGESVGYGRRFIADRPTTIATIPIGYADGIDRHWGSGVGYVTIRGQRAPIVGSICMDMLMVDCTGIPCREGDSVVIFGDNPTVIEIARALNTIPYEILAGISQRVKRVFFRE